MLLMWLQSGAGHTTIELVQNSFVAMLVPPNPN